MIKRWIAGILSVVLVLLCAGCGTGGSMPSKEDGQSAGGLSESIGSDVPSGDSSSFVPEQGAAGTTLRQPTLSPARALPEFDWEADRTAIEGVRSAINAFSFDLSGTLLKANPQRSLICSPLSVYFTLGALLNGTDEAGQQEMLEMTGLAAQGLTTQQANEGFASLLYQLTNARMSEEPYSPLAIANAVFVDDDYSLRSDFAQQVRDSLRSEAFEVDFADPAAADVINSWCSEHTEGLIEEVVPELDPETVAAIANAIYFSDRWDWEFNPDNNEELPFYGRSAETQGTFMVRDGMQIPYYEDDRLQAVNLEFLNGGGLMVLLPKENDAAALLAEMDASAFETLHDSFAPKTGVVKLPRFSMDYDTTLSDALTAMGLGSIFDVNRGIFNEMVAEAPLYVSQGIHKATITVEETGTTAAAVTVLTMMASSAPIEDTSTPFELICDRPFAYILYADTYYHAPVVLFTGILQDLNA